MDSGRSRRDRDRHRGGGVVLLLAGRAGARDGERQPAHRRRADRARGISGEGRRLRGLSHRARRQAVRRRTCVRSSVRDAIFIEHYAGSGHRDRCLERRGVRARGSSRHRPRRQEPLSAFPYASYALLSTDDVLAIRAYLATVAPVRAAKPVDTISFPFSQRYLLRVWNLLFVPGRPMQPDPTKTAEWNRGAYLVDGLGHCGECHTPRNVMFGLDSNKKFAGAETGGLAGLQPDQRSAARPSAAGATSNSHSTCRPVMPSVADRRPARWRK